MRIFIYLSLFVFPQLCLAQFVEKTSIYIPPTKSYQENYSNHYFESEKPFTSVSIKISDQNSFDGSFIYTTTDTFMLAIDEHGESPGSSFSKLVIFPEPVKSFLLYTSNIRDTIDVFLINGKDVPLFGRPVTLVQKNSLSENFNMPKMIDQSVWRIGLNAPDFERIIHDVHNVIIHHSATSNLVTDYTSAIRSIYLYHTEVRRWSDIGYNYVIAANGNIYKGRDPGANEQDLVMGAHFCASNRGTMGICMLGTFTEIAPTDTAFASLEKLLVWKLGKDDLDALGQYAHPLNDELNVISGHRDGCATECPGEVLYSRFDLLRERVHNQIILTGIELISNPDKIDSEIHIFPNPIEKSLSLTSPHQIESISVITLSGQTIKTFRNPETQLDLSFLPSGIYLLDIKSDNETCVKRIIKN